MFWGADQYDLARPRHLEINLVVGPKAHRPDERSWNADREILASFPDAHAALLTSIDQPTHNAFDRGSIK
ncbi:MAG: hypothetical protein Q7J28_01255 [Caulobacter sp.]|nr:hypothetical protein [Caulobacter sp.]